MSLVPYNLTALAEDDTIGSGKNIVAGATFNILKVSGGSPLIYSDEAGTVLISLPTVTDVNGELLFFIAEGEYLFIVAGETYRISIHNTNSVDTFADIANTQLQIGQIISIGRHTSNDTGGGDFRGFAGNVVTDYGKRINSGTPNVYAKRINYTNLSSAMFGTLANGTDETATVQKAIDAFLPADNYLYIPYGTKFNLNSLNFPNHIDIEYTVGDDLSNPGPSSDIGSGERVLFSVQSDYPTDPTGGLVIERRIAGVLNPSAIIEVRKSVPGADAYLGSGQTRLEPARASFAFQDDQLDRLLLQYQNYLTFSYFSGTYQHGWRGIFTLNGIGTAQWASVAPLGTTITGVTSGAKGHLISVNAGATVVLWFSGKFVAGEKLTDNNETTTAVITTAVFTLTPLQQFSQGLLRGNFSIGLPPESALARPLLAIGGDAGVQVTRTMSQHVDETVTDPGYKFCDSFEAGTPEGYKIAYDASNATAARRRLYLRPLNGTTNLAVVGATRASFNFTNAATIPATNSFFNLASITRTGTGTYAAVFTVQMARGDFIVAFGHSTYNDRCIHTSKTVNGFTILNFNTANVLTDLAGNVDVTVTGGDI